ADRQLVAVPAWIPLRQQLQPGLDAQLGPADVLAIQDPAGRLVVLVQLLHPVVAAVVGDFQALVGDGVGTQVPGLEHQGIELGELLAPPADGAPVGHPGIAADAGERLTLGEASRDLLADLLGVGAHSLHATGYARAASAVNRA